jgi:hypothetical protein
MEGGFNQSEQIREAVLLRTCVSCVIVREFGRNGGGCGEWCSTRRILQLERMMGGAAWTRNARPHLSSSSPTKGPQTNDKRGH